MSSIKQTNFGPEQKEQLFQLKKTVYGPVKSWRFGNSLGIDPIYQTSICSFNCIYCQLGEIQKVTSELDEYVSTEKVLEDFGQFLKLDQPIDIITYSGSGEPTLATNLKEMILGIRKLAPSIPQNILTNGTLLHRDEVRETLCHLDQITVKLDAGIESNFNTINRPDAEAKLKNIIAGAKTLRQEFKGKFEIQTMIMPHINDSHLEEYCNLVNSINPDVIQLNTPKRPYPLSWHRENRGNHLQKFDHQVTQLKSLSIEQAKKIEEFIQARVRAQIISFYRQ